MRRMLYIPYIDRKSVSDNPGFNEFYAFSDFLQKSGERVYWYVIVPPWVTDGLRWHDHMQYVYVDNVRDNLVSDIVGFSAMEVAQYFSRRGGKFIIDGILSNCVQFSLYLSRLLGDLSRGSRVPVFIRDHKMDGFSDSMDHGDMSFVASNYIGCHTFCRSKSESRLVFDFVRNASNPSIEKFARMKSFIWPLSYDVEKFNNDIGNDSVIFFVGGSFKHIGKRRRELRIASNLFVKNYVNVSLSTWSHGKRVRESFPGGDSSFISSIQLDIPRGLYDTTVSNSGVFVSFSESNEISDQEEEIGRLLHNQVGVFPYLRWAIDRVGSDYPFFYNSGNDDEALILAEWIACNYKEAVDSISHITERLLSEHCISGSSAACWDSMKSNIDSQYKIWEMKSSRSGKRTLFQTVYSIASTLGDEFYLDVFLDVLEEHFSWLKPFGRKGTLKIFGELRNYIPTLYDIREMLDNLGWIDVCDHSDIRLKRKREPHTSVHAELRGNYEQ